MGYKNLKRSYYSILLLLLISSFPGIQAQDVQKSRVIILTDVENEPDDSQSLVRLVLYSNVIDIKGIIATTSVHMKSDVHPETIRKVILHMKRYSQTF